MTNRRSDHPFAPGYDPRTSPSAPILNVPPVVFYLALAFAGVFVVLAIAPQRFAAIVEVAAAVSPRRFLAGPGANGGVLGMAAPLIGHIFIHANLPHLGFNSVWLLAFGAPVARRFGAGGPERKIGTTWGASVFLIFFFLCGAFGALFYVFIHPHQSTLLWGASGAIFGLFGGLARIAFYRPSPMEEGSRRIAPLTSRTVIAWTLFAILSNVMIGVFGGGVLGVHDTQIAWEAHIGGYLFGLLTFGFFDRLAHRA